MNQIERNARIRMHSDKAQLLRAKAECLSRLFANEREALYRTKDQVADLINLAAMHVEAVFLLETNDDDGYEPWLSQGSIL